MSALIPLCSDYTREKLIPMLFKSLLFDQLILQSHLYPYKYETLELLFLIYKNSVCMYAYLIFYVYIYIKYVNHFFVINV